VPQLDRALRKIEVMAEVKSIKYFHSRRRIKDFIRRFLAEGSRRQKGQQCPGRPAYRFIFHSRNCSEGPGKADSSL